jgi:hypothetical protein
LIDRQSIDGGAGRYLWIVRQNLWRVWREQRLNQGEKKDSAILGAFTEDGLPPSLELGR